MKVQGLCVGEKSVSKESVRLVCRGKKLAE